MSKISESTSKVNVKNVKAVDVQGGCHGDEDGDVPLWVKMTDIVNKSNNLHVHQTPVNLKFKVETSFSSPVCSVFPDRRWGDIKTEQGSLVV